MAKVTKKKKKKHKRMMGNLGFVVDAYRCMNMTNGSKSQHRASSLFLFFFGKIATE